MRTGETAPRTVSDHDTPPVTRAALTPGITEGSDLPPALTNPPGVDNLLAAVKRRWPLILSIGLGMALVAFLIAWSFVPGNFTSSIIFSIAPRHDGGEGEVASFARKQLVVLKNPQILSELLTFSDVQELREIQDHADDPVRWLQTTLVVDLPTQGSETVRATLQGEYPEDVATLLTALKRVYFKWHQADLESRTQLREGQVGEDLRNLDLRLAAKHKELVDLKIKLGLSDQKGVEQRLADLRDSRRDHHNAMLREKSDQKRLEDELDRIRQQMTNPQLIEISLTEIEEQFRTDVSLKQQLEEISKVNAQIASIRQIAAPETVEQSVRPLEAQKAALLNRYKKTEQQLRPALESSARARRMVELRREERQAQSALDRARANGTVAEDAIRAIEQETNQLRGSITGVNPEQAVQVERLNQDLNTLNESRKSLTAQMDRIRQEQNAGIRVSVLQEPQVPRVRTTDRKWKYGLVAALGAFFLAFLVVALIDFRHRRVNSTLDITQGLGLPVVGTLPLVPNRDVRGLLHMDGSEANPAQLALREAVDGIRTVVLHAGRQQPLHVILVASALHEEGKTTLASQLATSLARSGRRTLLLDCDLRHPSCHDLFNRPLAPGVCEVLRGEVPVEDAVQSTEQSLLFLLPAGRLDSKSLQALAQEIPRTLFAVLREQFEFIVIDSSPLLPVSDTLQIADHADAVLLAIMEQSSQLPAIHKAQQKLTMLGGRILGAVVGGTQQEIYQYGSRTRAAQKPQEV